VLLATPVSQSALPNAHDEIHATHFGQSPDGDATIPAYARETDARRAKGSDEEECPPEPAMARLMDMIGLLYYILCRYAEGFHSSLPQKIIEEVGMVNTTRWYKRPRLVFNSGRALIEAIAWAW
jgi:hypothetical protein